LSQKNTFNFPLKIFLLLFSFLINAQSTFEVSSPELQGVSLKKLNDLDSVMHSYVDNKDFSAVQTAIVKNGKLIHFNSYGYSDISLEKPLSNNDVFRIASMTKPIVSVALMMLYERGEFRLDDPVSKFIPEFKNLKKGKKEKPIKNEIKIIDLLRHSAGFEFKGPDGYMESIGLSLEEFVKESIKSPLLYEPGTQWRYSYSTDICGYLIEVISGMSLDKFLKTNIFEPLNMRDTFFELPKEKMDRLTTLYALEKKKLTVFDEPSTSLANNVTLFSGAGGLLSTTNDYLVFCQMLLNGGVFNKQRIIQTSTINLMLEDHAKGLKYKKLIFGKKKGFGLGFEIINEENTKFGSKGTYGWGGIFGTYFRIDPVENMIFIYMTQSFETYNLKLSEKFRTLVYDSLL
tara:strand:+ start:7726 stop:8931 length:1206 start_codon:yes stop_codon:yes gene_type:complete